MSGIEAVTENPNRLAERAIEAVNAGREAEVLPELAMALTHIRDNALLWQCAGLLHRALDQHAEALVAFGHAARLAPDDARIAHGRARVALEAGIDAVALFAHARAFNPGDGSVHLGLAAARFAVGDGIGAIDELDAVLAQSPGWIEGHSGFLRLCAMMGERARGTAAFDRALAAQPRNADLWRALILDLITGERHDEAHAAIRRGRASIGDDPFFDANEASILSEAGDVASADLLFARVAHLGDEALVVRRVRHLLRNGRLDQALPVIEQWIARPDASLIWPNAAIAWRMADDPRWQWLEGDPQLVSVVDLADRLPELDRLASTLRDLHLARAQPFDQSVRGGTQTDGQLFQRIDPIIQALRGTIVTAIEAHIAQLPAIDPAHPTLRHRRDRPPRFAGAWSVRLTGGGHHTNHVHPAGWISSAFYVAVPSEGERGTGDAGWLTLGEPQAALGLDLPPIRRIEPKPGRLVLFPSTMWHGTRPFDRDERLTVAFDVAPPR